MVKAVLLMLIAMAVAKEEFEDIVKNLRTEMSDMNERLELNEKTLEQSNRHCNN